MRTPQMLTGEFKLSYQDMRRVHRVDYYKKNRKSIDLSLEKTGGISIDISDDKTHFSVLLSLIYYEGKKESYPSNVVRDLFSFKKGVDITKTSEYNKVIRYIKRWEEVGIIKKSKEKAQHNKSYFEVDYNNVIKHLLVLLNQKSSGWIRDNTKRLNYKNNDYIISFIKLYFYLLSLEAITYRDFTLNIALMSLVDNLFKTIDSGDIFQQWEMGKEDAIIKYSGYNDEKLKEIGLEVERSEGEVIGVAIKDPNYEKKIPKEILKKSLDERKIDYVNKRLSDPISNLDEYMEKYEGKDKDLYDFFHFVFILHQYYYDYDNEKNHLNLVIPALIDFVRIKANKKEYYDDLDKTSKSWKEQAKDLEKMKDNIYEYHFPY